MKKSIVVAILLAGMVGVDAQVKQDTILKTKEIEEVELFGEIGRKPKKLEIITRMPLAVRDQIQSISVISDKAISEMGALTITDAAKNIPGVVLFSNYGGGAESMSIRGYRGTPTLKNGVLMNSDFRTSSMIADMQGVESVQVIRGSAAITQGFGSALGAAGGVINLVTKTPRFINQTNVGFRYGSWNLYRPTLDFQRVLDNAGRVAVRLNVAYQNNKSYTDFVKGERLYVNPSVAIRPDDKTNIVLEMDYLHNNRTPNRGTINLASDDTYAIYDLPKNKFLGFESDYAKNESYSYMISADRALTDKFKVRVAYMASDNTNESVSTGRFGTIGRGANIRNYALRTRSVAKSGGEDHSKVFQADFIGHSVQTGFLKHTFQLGFDWKQSHTNTYQYSAGVNINTNANPIDVTQEVNNFLTEEQLALVNAITKTGVVENAKTPIIGLMAQEVMEIGKYAKVILGARWSSYNGNVMAGKKTAWDPQFGLMISPLENINLFGSYTTTTNLRGNNNPTLEGGTIGASITRQWETGVKSDWFNERLRFNVNLFWMDLNNLSYQLTDDLGNNTGYYGFAGDLTRKGFEVDLIGKILPELDVMMGYAYLDAKYKNSPAYVNNSRPMMSAMHTANAWLNYTFKEGFLKGLNFGGGVYYVGDRPVNEYTQTYTAHDTTPGLEPFNLKAYTTLNAQIGYTYKNASIKVFANNLTDAIGYNAYYRGGFLNRNDPRNFAVQVNYKF